MVKQIPWIRRSFNFDFPVSLFPVIFSRLEGSIFRLHSILLNADEEFCSRCENSWSVKENLGHLYDLEELWWKRLEDFQLRRTVLTAADMTNAKTNQSGHNEKTLEQLLQQFTTGRQKILEYIYLLDEEMLERTSLHPRLNQPMRLVGSLFFVAEHDDHHIATISSRLRTPAG